MKLAFFSSNAGIVHVSLLAQYVEDTLLADVNEDLVEESVGQFVQSGLQSSEEPCSRRGTTGCCVRQYSNPLAS